ncbi:MAG: serine/threonine-protein phosphatase [Planctomycetes bacterium]|nr:serine/threonine-protein phosphatase [Planctomycetota bacterium]
MPIVPHVLLFDAAPQRAEQVHNRLLQKGLPADRMELVYPAGDAMRPGADIAVVVLEDLPPERQSDRVATLLDRLATEQVATVVWGASYNPAQKRSPHVNYLASDASIDEVIGRLGALAHYAPLVKGLERELGHLQRLGTQLNRYFGEIDQEMRLAGRLQRDFLPRGMPEVSPLAFASLYRPASWVSGDMYDVFRVDETHVGVFVADAMGHGIAAGLMTMFLRQALVSKQVDGTDYELVCPADAMANLHRCLVAQKLPNCQFVTAAYAIIDAARLELLLARGGHPYPFHIRRDGTISEIQPGGGLLGVVDMPLEFEEQKVQLAPGDKVIFYTDGLEDVLGTDHNDETQRAQFNANLREWAPLSADGFVQALAIHLDRQEGSLHPADDVTVVVLEVTG